jgi:phospholipid transport system transporter-binding protein
MAELRLLAEGRYALTGRLDHAAAAELWQPSRRQFAAIPPRLIDLGGLERIDSAGIALLVYWLKCCQPPPRFVNMPARIYGLIAVADLQELLPEATDVNDSM